MPYAKQVLIDAIILIRHLPNHIQSSNPSLFLTLGTWRTVESYEACRAQQRLDCGF